MDVLLMRHSRTAGNIERRYVGVTDEPLCAEGIALAQSSGIDTRAATVYVSPLKRALETAGIKFPNARLHVVEDLREMNFGDFEGRSAAEMERDEAYISWLKSNCMLPCPNGEGLEDFSDRVCAAFDGIVRECIKNGDGKLVIVAHGGSIMSILNRYGKPERQYYEWYVDNCCFYRTKLDEASWAHSPLLTGYAMFEILS
jgi:alpha-ribazole phosphatase